jgi:large subunit ribosomal protein L9
MKVLLKEDMDNLGYAGEVHDVAPGYGRNYLIPRGLAVKATPSVLKQARAWRKRAEARREQIRAEHRALSERIEDLTLTFAAKASESGRLYGSVTTNQIVDALNEALGTDFESHTIPGEPLRKLGSHEVTVRLSGEFQPEVDVVIEPEGEVIAESEGEELPETADVAPEIEEIELPEEMEGEAETEEEEEA